ncbi:hypothetical protein SOVF_135770 [Spinacia oleracea]|nr:hypothetical protein SOVF_135770 [Spinacia oleracea]
MHYSDVLVLNLDTVSWTTLVTTGPGPGPRDSHTATLWGNKIIVFGGTNGSKKVNDLHILDLDSKEWTQPTCSGSYPSARESHTATLVGDGGQLAVFGGSGEGVGNYLNDVHFLDLKTMSWSSPMVKGDYSPPPRDSHVSVAVGRKVFVYGGDCGDRYHGDVDVFDVDSLTWSRLEVLGPSPGRRAGHAAIGIGTKVYVVGGVGDKKYYNDTWVLDTTISSWSKLEICGQPPQGRFSHTAIVTDSDIAIYGGCGEDERPLGELLILQLGEDHPNGRYNISMCKSFGNHRNQRRRRSPQSHKTILLGSCIETETNNTNDPKTTHSKRTRTMNTNTFEKETEQEEHSLSLSQNSSPSQSDQEQTTTTVQNPTSSSITVPQSFSFPSIMNQLNKPPRQQQTQQSLPDVYILGEHRPNQRHAHFLPPHTVKTEVELLTAEGRHLNHSVTQSLVIYQPFSAPHTVKTEVELLTAEGRHLNHSVTQSLIGAEVHGKVDGSFDSGYLMTANVNGRMFRGVLFPPVSSFSP